VNRLRGIWRVVWRLAICAILLLWIFHTIFLHEARAAWQRHDRNWEQLSAHEQRRLAWRIGPRELWTTTARVDTRWFALSIAIVGAILFVGVLRWRLVLQTHGLLLPFPRAATISLVAHFFNSFLLGSTGGDLLKAYYAARLTHHKKTEAVVTVFADRLIGLFAMLLFATGMLAVNFHLVQRHRPLAFAALLVLLMLLACASFLAISFWGGLSRPWPNARDWLRNLPKGELLERSLDACRLLGQRPGMLVRTLSLSMALNTLCVFQVLALARGMQLDLPVLAIFLVVPVIICISALPITPSGLGLRENLYVLLLAHPVVQVPATEALSLSLLAFAGSVTWSLAGGLVYLGMRDRRALDESSEDSHPAPSQPNQDQPDNGQA
jgi:glycosyltransferase 2 family protein